MQTATTLFTVSQPSQLLDIVPAQPRPILETVVRWAAKFSVSHQQRLEAFLYTSMMDGLRAIVLQILTHSGAWGVLQQGQPLTESGGFDNGLCELTVELAAQLGMVKEGRLTAPYLQPIKVDLRAYLVNDVTERALSELASHPYQREIQALLGMKLINQAEPSSVLFRGLSKGKYWQQLASNSAFIYQRNFCKYLLELLNVDLRNKTQFSGSESFYTKLGQEAFVLFNRDSFKETIQLLQQAQPVKNVLDIGCGYGDYLESLLETTKAKMIGVERQTAVAEATRQRFANEARVSIANIDVGDFVPAEPFDLVLLNYVLFYIDEAGQLPLFHKIKQRLSSGGTVLICQYFPKMCDARRQLIAHYGKLDMTRKIESYFIDRMVQAEALLNETLNDFCRAERWDVLNARLEKSGLAVKAISSADPFYYSNFIHIGHKEECKLD